MFGYYRFFLATMVLISHIEINLQGFGPGAAAVISFYMLAGFVVCNLFTRKFIGEKPNFLLFYFERALRIFPLYIFVALLTILFLIVTKYGSPDFNPKALINNFLIVPLNYYMLIDNSILQAPKLWLVPAAWSLALELQVYLILPFMVINKPIKVVVSIMSLLVFIIASFGIISPEMFGYRLFPGVLFMFALGMTAYNNISKQVTADLFDKYFPVFTYVILVIMLIVLGISKMLLVPYVRETILGILIGFPIITYISKSTSTLPKNRFIGDLSYGLFLSHYLAIWLIDHYFQTFKTTSFFLYSISVFTISLLISIIGVLIIERSIKRYRFNLSSSIKAQSSTDPMDRLQNTKKGFSI